MNKKSEKWIPDERNVEGKKYAEREMLSEQRATQRKECRKQFFNERRERL